jgi:alpha-L-fucosidase
MLIKCVGRGGNLLMNVGPRGDGKIDDKDVAILNGIGEWMNVNGESIHGAGRSPLPVQAWGQSTRKGQVLYLHVFDWPRDGRLTVGGLTAKIDKAYLLADKKRSPLNVERLNELDAVIHVPTEAPDSGVSTIAVEVAGEITVDTDRLLSTQTSNKFHVFDALFDGNLRCGSGHIHQDYVTDWSKSSDRVIWPVRLNEDASFEVLLTYSAHGKKPTKGGTFVSTIGDQTLSGPAVDGVSEQTSSLGMIDLKQGTFEISIKPDQIENAKFMNLHSITLRPALRASSRTVTE